MSMQRTRKVNFVLDFVLFQFHNIDDVSVSFSGMTPLHLAAWAGKVEPALLLLDAGAETNLCSRSGATPLHLASEHGNYGVVSLDSFSLVSVFTERTQELLCYSL